MPKKRRKRAKTPRRPTIAVKLICPQCKVNTKTHFFPRNPKEPGHVLTRKQRCKLCGVPWYFKFVDRGALGFSITHDLRQDTLEAMARWNTAQTGELVTVEDIIEGIERMNEEMQEHVAQQGGGGKILDAAGRPIQKEDE